MRSRRSASEEVAEVARRRLELLRTELAGISRSTPVYDGEVEGRGLASSTREEPTPVRDRDQPSRPVLDVPEGGGGRLGDPTERGNSAGTQPGRHAHRPVAATARAGGWVHDRLPPTVQGRVGLTSNHLTLVALLVAAALAVTGWWVIRASGGDTVVPPTVAPAAGAASAVAVVQPGTPAASPAPEAGATSSTVIVVDVAGKVRRPGIATLPLGSRVVDAIEAAGGVRRGVDLTALNLARLLVDGEQIVVGIPQPGGVAAPAVSAGAAAGATGQLVNLNSATQAELEELPGVGPVTAQAILQWRTDNGAFTSVDELLEVSGIGDVTLAELAPLVTI